MSRITAPFIARLALAFEKAGADVRHNPRRSLYRIRGPKGVLILHSTPSDTDWLKITRREAEKAGLEWPAGVPVR